MSLPFYVKEKTLLYRNTQLLDTLEAEWVETYKYYTTVTSHSSKGYMRLIIDIIFLG